MIRTDLAYESLPEDAIPQGINVQNMTISNVNVNAIRIEKELEDKIGKKQGDYITIFCNMHNATNEAVALTAMLKRLVPSGKALVVGLGNRRITADSLGVTAASYIVPTSHIVAEKQFSDLNLRSVSVNIPMVMAQTGVESADQLLYMVEGVKPDLIIAVDSLTCREYDRLGQTLQVTNTGIQLGSGVKNHRKAITVETFGIPVIAIGVPTVIEIEQNNTVFFASPKDVDIVIRHFSKVIASAVNAVLNPSLSKEEVEQLLF